MLQAVANIPGKFWIAAVVAGHVEIHAPQEQNKTTKVATRKSRESREASYKVREGAIKDELVN